MKILHLGCGQNKYNSAIGVDINFLSDADVICDLNLFSYPFASNSFDLVICEHVLEHLDDVIHIMDEIHHILMPSGRVIIRVPYFSSVYYYSDPTHRHPFTLHSFDYFLANSAVRNFHYSPVEYRLIRAEFPPPNGASFLKRFFYIVLNKYKNIYERHFAFILPRHLLEFELEAVKQK